MFIHARVGKLHSEIYHGSDKDSYFVGQPTLVDRVAIARITASGKRITIQNWILYPFVVLTAILIDVMLWLAATTSEVIAVVAIGGTVALIVAVIGLVINDYTGMEFPDYSYPPTARAADWWLLRVRKNVIRVSSSLVLMGLAADSRDTVSDWIEKHQDLKSEIDALLTDDWIVSVEKAVNEAPDDLPLEDRQVVNDLRRQLEAKLAPLQQVVTLQNLEAAKVAAEKQERDSKARADLAAAEHSSWQENVTKLTERGPDLR